MVLIMKYSSDEIINQLMKHEGIVLTPYDDSIGVKTIGIGRNLVSSGIAPFELEMLGFSPTTEATTILKITSGDAEWLCRNDIFRCEKELLIFYPKALTLSKNRQLVLIDMLFNLGQTRLLKFVKFFKFLTIDDYHRAADEMLNSKWARQVGKRAETLASMMREG